MSFAAVAVAAELVLEPPLGLELQLPQRIVDTVVVVDWLQFVVAWAIVRAPTKRKQQSQQLPVTMKTTFVVAEIVLTMRMTMRNYHFYFDHWHWHSRMLVAVRPGTQFELLE